MADPHKRVGLLFHPLVPEARRLAEQLAPLVEASGGEPWLESAWAEEEMVAAAGGCGLLVTLGGDGTILRVARAALAAEEGRDGERRTAPILTVDFGKLGFLTELKPEQAVEGLRRVLAGDFWIEERRFLRARLERAGTVVEERLALNDVVLARGDGPHAIRLMLCIDGAETARYTADGMIVASSTGSTAYALGAGGPIMGPDVEGLLAVPVAPHLAVARAFVVSPTSRITLEASAYKATVITLDGQINLPYESGERLHVTRSAAVARFVRTGPRNYFYATLQEKLRRG